MEIICIKGPAGTNSLLRISDLKDIILKIISYPVDGAKNIPTASAAEGRTPTYRFVKLFILVRNIWFNITVQIICIKNSYLKL